MKLKKEIDPHKHEKYRGTRRFDCSVCEEHLGVWSLIKQDRHSVKTRQDDFRAVGQAGIRLLPPLGCATMGWSLRPHLQKEMNRGPPYSAVVKGSRMQSAYH